MPQVDLPLSELLAYLPDLTAQHDFDDFWLQQRSASEKQPLHPKLTRLQYPIKSIEVYQLQYDGFDGTPISGWYILPSDLLTNRPIPVVIHYHGYSWFKGIPLDFLHWIMMGYAVLSIDIRGQAGVSPDHVKYASGTVMGWMTLGIEDPNNYYFKYVYMDAVRAIDFVQTRKELDHTRIALTGGSQGGGITLAVAGIDARAKLAMPIFPYLSNFRRAVDHHANGPYVEIKNWFRMYDPEHNREEDVYRTLSYFDAMNHASRVKARTFMAITLQDTITPPSTCFAAYNHLPASKDLKIYPDYGHEALPFHTEAMLKFVSEHL